MKNKYLKELKNLKKLPTPSLSHKSFKLPYLTISSTYQNYSKDIFQIMDNIYQDLKIDVLISKLLDGKEVNFTEKRQLSIIVIEIYPKKIMTLIQ